MSLSLVSVFGLLFVHTADAATADYIGTEFFQVKPAIEIGTEYRSNLYLSTNAVWNDAASTPLEKVIPGTAILVNPTLKMRSNTPFLNLEFGSGYGAKKYLADDQQGLNSFSDLSVNLNGRLLPRSSVGVLFSDKFSSNNRPMSEDGGGGEDASLIRVYKNKSMTSVILGNDIIDMSLGTIYNYQRVDITATDSILNQGNTLGGALQLNWQFLPKTDLFLDGSYVNNNWTEATIDTSGGDPYCIEDCGNAVSDSTMWNAAIGMKGQITPKSLVRIMIGTGSATYTSESTSIEINSSDDGVTWQEGLRAAVGVKYYPTPYQTLTIDFTREFQDVYFTNYKILHQGSLKHSVEFNGRVGIETSVLYRNDDYDGVIDRTDHNFGTSLETILKLQSHLDLSAGVNWRRLDSVKDVDAALDYDDVGVTVNLRYGY